MASENTSVRKVERTTAHLLLASDLVSWLLKNTDPPKHETTQITEIQVNERERGD